MSNQAASRPRRSASSAASSLSSRRIFSRKPRRSTRNLRPSGMVVNCVSSRSRGGSSARRSAALAVAQFGRIGRRLHLGIGARHRIGIGIEAGERAQEFLASGLVQLQVGLRQLGRPIARADLAAAARQAGAHLRGDRLVLHARRHVAPDRGDAADGPVEQTGRRRCHSCMALPAVGTPIIAPAQEMWLTRCLRPGPR